MVVEAIAPLHFRQTHRDWESLLLERDYVEAAFDGINRFYVPREHEALAPVLAYPVSVLDRFVLHDFQWRRDTSAPHPEELEPRLPDERSRRIEREAHETRHQLEAMESTLSWRITRPLRVARRLQQRERRDGSSAPPARVTQPSVDELADRAAAAARVLQAASLLDGHDRGDVERRIARAGVRTPRARPVARDVLTRVRGVARARRLRRTVSRSRDRRRPGQSDSDCPALILSATCSARVSPRQSSPGLAPTSGLDIVRDRVVVLVEAMVTTDLHTGIQRVARECISRWLDDQALVLAHFDPDRGVVRILSAVGARANTTVARPPLGLRRDRSRCVGRCRLRAMRSFRGTVELVVTELLLDRDHCNALRTLASDGCSRLARVRRLRPHSNRRPRDRVRRPDRAVLRLPVRCQESRSSLGDQPALGARLHGLRVDARG